MNAYSAALLSGFFMHTVMGNSYILNLDLICSVLRISGSEDHSKHNNLSRLASAQLDELHVLFYYPYEEIMQIVQE